MDGGTSTAEQVVGQTTEKDAARYCKSQSSRNLIQFFAAISTSSRLGEGRIAPILGEDIIFDERQVELPSIVSRDYHEFTYILLDCTTPCTYTITTVTRTPNPEPTWRFPTTRVEYLLISARKDVNKKCRTLND
jgi:hypothetical protein